MSQSSAIVSQSDLSSDAGSEEFFRLKNDSAEKLIKRVKRCLETNEEEDIVQDKGNLYYFPKKKSRVLPAHPVLKTIMEREWKRPDKRLDVGPRFKSLYKLDPAASEEWELPSKVDPAISRLSKRSFFPSDDSYGSES